MCQCRFINCHKCTTLVVDVDNGGGYDCVRAEGKSPTYLQFCYEPKTALTNTINKMTGGLLVFNIEMFSGDISK